MHMGQVVIKKKKGHIISEEIKAAKRMCILNKRVMNSFWLFFYCQSFITNQIQFRYGCCDMVSQARQSQ